MRLFSLVADRDPKHGEPVSTGSEPVRSRCQTGAASAETEHHTVREHAERLIQWLQDADLGGSVLLHDAIFEFYADMIAELGWGERSWNPVARELDLISTGGRKPYEWVVTRTGAKRRKRVYPIPRRGETAPEIDCNVHVLHRAS